MSEEDDVSSFFRTAATWPRTVAGQLSSRVQHGRRYAVIVQADDLLALSTVIVCPTSSSTPAASFHPEVTIAGEPTRIMCEMIGAVDARSLGKQVGNLALDEMRRLDDALLLILDLR